jgi:thioredoxin reductase
VSHFHDCLIVGGGAAGLNAALVLGRARRDVLLIDAGRQSNRSAHAIGGLLGQDGTAPAELYAAGRAQLAQHANVVLERGEVEAIEPVDGAFRVRLAGGGDTAARRILLATGMEYVAPDLPGVAERWGDTVFHCPFCHGWEVRDGALAVLGDGQHDVLRAMLLRGWSDDVVLLAGDLDAAEREQLAAAGIAVDERPVAGVRGERATVVFEDGSELPRDGLLVAAPMRQRSPLAANLGLDLTDAGAIAVDALARTSLPGVFAAGDVAGVPSQVAAALGSGAMAGVFVHQHLLAEAHGLPFPLNANSSAAAPAEAAR